MGADSDRSDLESRFYGGVFDLYCRSHFAAYMTPTDCPSMSLLMSKCRNSVEIDFSLKTTKLSKIHFGVNFDTEYDIALRSNGDFLTGSICLCTLCQICDLNGRSDVI